MKILRTRASFIRYRSRLSAKSIGFVPTMGALHEGHATLVRRARRECDRVIVSIFVNPIQFGPKEDFRLYPRPEKEDLILLKKLNVDAVFIPKNSLEVYPEKSEVRVHPRRPLIQMMEGVWRPGHFEGVATVVAKLFNLVQPTRAYFGEKDYQQLQVVKAINEDLFFGIKIIACPTLREKSGLAMSSRNAYFKAVDKEAAAEMQAILKSASSLMEAQQKLQRRGFGVEYLECWSEDLSKKLPGPKGRWLIAAQFRGVRLIDNIYRD